LAMDFRAEIKRLNKASSGWFFDIWQPANITKPACFPLKATENWHGFKSVDNNHLTLDPIKVTVLLPGIKNDKLDTWGIPANIVAKFLESHGVIVEKTGPYTMLFLFSVGITKAKTMNLLSALNKFKQLYDENALIKTVLPMVYAEHPDFYKDMRIQVLAKNIHSLMQKHDLPKAMYHAFDILPTVVLTPHQAYQRLIKQAVKRVPLKSLMNKVSAVMILPYPPGVPLIMPGEKITKETQVILDFLLMLIDIGQAYPGFETDIHGVNMDENGDAFVQVVDPSIKRYDDIETQ